MPETIQEFIRNLPNLTSTRCSYVFVKGINKGLVCNRGAINDRHLPVKNWRCPFCISKKATNTCFDNVETPTLTVAAPILTWRAPTVASVSIDPTPIRSLHGVNLGELLLFLLSLDQNRMEEDEERDRQVQERQRESLNHTQPLLNNIDDLPEQVNREDKNKPPPKIYEEDEDCEKPCSICLSKAPRFALIPCGHLVFCDVCKDKTAKMDKKECPICRISFSSLIRIFN